MSVIDRLHLPVEHASLLICTTGCWPVSHTKVLVEARVCARCAAAPAGSVVDDRSAVSRFVPPTSRRSDLRSDAGSLLWRD